MRWLLLLIAGTACMAAPAAPLPQINTGTHPQPIEIWETPWFSGFISTSVAFLVGEVSDVTSEIRTAPQQTTMWETCDVRVESACGHLEQIQGIKLAKLICSEEGSPYVPVAPEWGRIRHLKKGQRILLLMHEHEGPSFGFEALIELTEATRTLPEILQRTACKPSEFTDKDLLVVEAASSLLHDQLVKERAIWRELHKEDMPERSLATYTLAAAASVMGVLAISYLVRRIGKRDLKQSTP